MQRKALIQGVQRINPAIAAKLQSNQIPVDFVYYGHINNALLRKFFHNRKQLTRTDPAFGNATCLPHDEVEPAIDALGAFTTINLATYKKVLRNNSDMRWLDDTARALSTLTAVTTATFLNMAAIKHATADMGAYLLSPKIGSEIRKLLQTPLQSALLAGDDICLISHSMGCMVSYDLLWKFSHMSEYDDVQSSGNKVNLWLTLGCPLGEAGVKRNLYGGNRFDKYRYPAHIIKDWVNIAAKDDFIAHDASMRDDYKKMPKYGYIDSIKDKGIYNCYAADGHSNPHKFYGYLSHGTVGDCVAKWMGS